MIHPNSSCLSLVADPDYQKDYLKWVSVFVSKNKNAITLKNPAGARLKMGGLEDTVYKGNDVKMEVVGVVEGTSCPCDQLVLMTCEDRKVYAFDGEEEELHMVAESLEELSEKGLKYPASQSYYKGEAFKDMVREKEREAQCVKGSPPAVSNCNSITKSWCKANLSQFYKGW
uniref:Uncharacterized protein n=1 Tax=Sander lucioperca TaxID=283035 RepID=A0A8D0ALA2_SANLU